MKRTDIFLNGSKLTSAAVADDFLLRLRGLIGRDAGSLGGLVIRPCCQVHTCFMGEAIDIIYIGKTGSVLRIDREVPKNRFLKACRGAKSVLELPARYAEANGIKTGDIITFNAS